jgi:hypothetical protein
MTTNEVLPPQKTLVWTRPVQGTSQTHGRFSPDPRHLQLELPRATLHTLGTRRQIDLDELIRNQQREEEEEKN